MRRATDLPSSVVDRPAAVLRRIEGMGAPMLNDEVMTALARFFDEGRGPSHDELDRLVTRAGLRSADPRASGDTTVGKMKRIRAVLGYAIDNEPAKGAALVKSLVGSLRACGCFRGGSDQFAGEASVDALRSSLRNLGMDLDASGTLRPTLLENLEGTELTDALWAYVRRARTGADDPELVIGTAKNLEEAAARHVLKEKTGQYPTHGNFPTALAQAFMLLGLSPSTHQLDRDPYRALQEAIYLLGCAVNRLRNEKGDGHGRPEEAVATRLEGRLSSEAAALVTELLLSALARQKA